MVLPFSILIIFDRVVPNGASTTLWLIFSIILVSLFLDFYIKQAENKFIASFVKRVDKHITNQVFQAICYANISHFNKLTSGEYLERIESIKNITSFMGGEWIKAIINLITSLIIISLIMVINLGSGITLLCSSIIILIFSYKLASLKNNKLQEKSDTEGFTSSRIIEIVSNPLSLKSSAMEYRMENSMDKLVSNRENLATEFHKLESEFSLKLGFIQQVSVSIVVVYCAFSVFDLKMSQGVMAALILLTNRFFSPYQQVMQTMSHWKLVSMQQSRISELCALKTEPDPEQPSIGTLTSVAIKNTQYQFDIGELYLLSGASGSGKTLITKAISQEFVHDKFKVEVNGKDLSHYNYNEWQHKIARVDKNSGFVDGTIIDNITCFKPNLYKTAYILCEAMNIKDTINKLKMGFYTEISSGKAEPFSRQVHFSLIIIRAFLSQKSIIIIDDIDMIYDKDFSNRLISCIRPRADSMICIFISNKFINNKTHDINHIQAKKEALPF